MPTYTAIAVDRLIESGGSKSMTTSKSIHESKFERRNNIPNSSFDRSKNSSSSKLERKIIQSNAKMDDTNSKSSVTGDRKDHWTQISPALYTIPKPTPLPDSPSYPDSPSSFPPSPYIINHKRRGPRLSQSFTEDDFGTQHQALNGEKIDENLRDTEKELPSTFVDDPSISRETVNCAKENNLLFTTDNLVKDGEVTDLCDGELFHQDLHNGSAGQNGTMKSVAFNLRRGGEVDDFFDPQESLSVRSFGESESNGGLQRCLSSMTPMGEFYDAWEGRLPFHNLIIFMVISFYLTLKLNLRCLFVPLLVIFWMFSLLFSSFSSSWLSHWLPCLFSLMHSCRLYIFQSTVQILVFYVNTLLPLSAFSFFL